MLNLFFNVPIDAVSWDEANKMCLSAILGNKCQLLSFVNAHCFNIAQKNQLYLEALHQSDFVFNDGIGMKLGSYFSSVKFEANLNGTDLIPVIIQMAFKLNKKIFLVGGKPGVAKMAKREIEKQYPQIQISGIHHGYFAINDTEIVTKINNSKADLLIVGMGVPLQELWINSIKHDLSSVKLCVAGGAIIDFISGNIQRAPLWIRKSNLEWLYRLWLEPKRMWRRYIIGNFKFFFYIFSNLLNKLAKRRPINLTIQN